MGCFTCEALALVCIPKLCRYLGSNWASVKKTCEWDTKYLILLVSHYSISILIPAWYLHILSFMGDNFESFTSRKLCPKKPKSAAILYGIVFYSCLVQRISKVNKLEIVFPLLKYSHIFLIIETLFRTIGWILYLIIFMKTFLSGQYITAKPHDIAYRSYNN